MHGASQGKRGIAMIESQSPQWGDMVITQTVDGFWTHRLLDGRHTPSIVDTLEAAVGSGGLIAEREHVSLWLWNAHRECRLLVSSRHVRGPERVVSGALSAAN